ncbi:hypothetical protein ACFX2K_036436 [Malus domestica]
MEAKERKETVQIGRSLVSPQTFLSEFLKYPDQLYRPIDQELYVKVGAKSTGPIPIGQLVGVVENAAETRDGQWLCGRVAAVLAAAGGNCIESLVSEMDKKNGIVDIQIGTHFCNLDFWYSFLMSLRVSS